MNEACREVERSPDCTGRSPLEDTIWGVQYGSCAAIAAAFDRMSCDYHRAIMFSGVPDQAAACLRPLLGPESRGIDFGCGSGAMGIALRRAGLRHRLDGLDLSSGMMELARMTGCYGRLGRVNLLAPEEYRLPEGGYDFAVTLGLIGDYMPYYAVLPLLVQAVPSGAPIGFGVEPKSTPQRPLLRLAEELELDLLGEVALFIPAAVLERETYHFFVARRRQATSHGSIAWSLRHPERSQQAESKDQPSRGPTGEEGVDLPEADPSTGSG